MENENKQEQGKEQQSKENQSSAQQSGAGKPEAKPNEEKQISPLEEARVLAEVIKKRNEEFKELIERQEKLAAEARLEGKGYAGKSPAMQEQELKYNDALNFWKGTPIEEAIKKHGNQ